MAERHGATLPQIRLAWLVAQGRNIVPIVGSSRPETIRNSVAAASTSLDVIDLELLA